MIKFRIYILNSFSLEIFIQNEEEEWKIKTCTKYQSFQEFFDSNSLPTDERTTPTCRFFPDLPLWESFSCSILESTSKDPPKTYKYASSRRSSAEWGLKKKKKREENAGMKGASLGEVRTSPSPFRRGERDHAQFRPDKTLALGDNWKIISQGLFSRGARSAGRGSSRRVGSTTGGLKIMFRAWLASP